MPTSISLSCLKHQSRAPPEMYLRVGAVVGRGACGVPAMYSEADRQKFCSYCLVAKSCMTLLWPHGLYPARCLCPWNSPDKNTGVDSHFLLQGIFLTEGLKPHLLHLLPWKVESLPLSQQGRPRQKVVLQELMQQNSHQPWTFQDLFLQLKYNCVNLITFLFFFFLIFVYLAMLCLSGSLWDLASWPGIKPRSPALWAQS